MHTVTQVEFSVVYPQNQVVFHIQKVDTHFEGYTGFMERDATIEKPPDRKVYAKHFSGPYMIGVIWFATKELEKW